MALAIRPISCLGRESRPKQARTPVSTGHFQIPLAAVMSFLTALGLLMRSRPPASSNNPGPATKTDFVIDFGRENGASSDSTFHFFFVGHSLGEFVRARFMLGHDQRSQPNCNSGPAGSGRFVTQFSGAK